ncbi:L,D-transpeptidase [Loktanella salsilacus]|uniref:L,D-transpeptidase n=1 Tax=Loktanella salsilacus TaxID=195913 RepID=UPI0037361145
MKRRHFLAGVGAAMLSTPAIASNIWQRHLVTMARPLAAGQIHVDTDQRFLYLTLGGHQALRYGVSVGAEGRQFHGTAVIARKAVKPSWVPTRNMIRMEPSVYGPFAGGLPGGHPHNPLGAAALYLHRNGRDTLYRIHGTQQPDRIGQAFSSGCVRLENADMLDLYARVSVGTVVQAT